MTIHTIGRRSLLMAAPALAIAGRAFAASPPPDNPVSNEPPPQRDVQSPPQMTPAAIAMQAWIDQFGRPTARTTLNGQGAYEFMVDTGANSTVIAQRHVTAIGAPIIGTQVVNGTTGSHELPVALVDVISTGAVTRKGVHVAVMPDETLDSDGILGADIFAGMRLSFDITAKRVEVQYPGRGSIYGGITGTRLRGLGELNIRNGMLAEVAGSVGGVATKLLLDTGAQSCIMNLPLAKELGRARPGIVRTPNVRVTGVTGQTLVGEYFELPIVDMGRVAVRDAGAVAADAPIFAVWGLTRDPTMIVGVDVLSRLRAFTIDYGTKRFEAKPMAALVAGNGSNA